MRHVPSDYELVIRPTRGWFNLDLVDVWRYRDLLFLLVQTGFAGSDGKFSATPDFAAGDLAAAADVILRHRDVAAR